MVLPSGTPATQPDAYSSAQIFRSVQITALLESLPYMDLVGRPELVVITTSAVATTALVGSEAQSGTVG